MSDTMTTIARTAKNNGWTLQVQGLLGWWDVAYVRGGSIIHIRVRGNRVTGLTINDGSGVIYIPKANKRHELVAALEAAVAIERAHRDVSKDGSFARFCACGQGYSGKAAAARLQDHITNPDPMSTGALLIQAMR